MSEAAPENDPDINDTDISAYLAGVMAEIDEEVRRRRASGDLPPRLERELDELFLAHAPVGGSRGKGLHDAIRQVDSFAFIDPVVPVGSNRSGGAVVKKGLRKASLWYMGWVTHQISQFASGTARSLHLIEEMITDLRRDLDTDLAEPAGLTRVPSTHHAQAWWVPAALASLGTTGGRCIHLGAGDGWLVTAAHHHGVDAYGVDPDLDVSSPTSPDLDLRREGVFEHLGAVAASGVRSVVMTGVVEGLSAGERKRLLVALDLVLEPDGVVIIHSVTPGRWGHGETELAADLAPGKPLHPATWVHLLEAHGFAAEVSEADHDYLVIAHRRHSLAAR